MCDLLQAGAQEQHNANHTIEARQPPATTQDVGQAVLELPSVQWEQSQEPIAHTHAQAPSQPAADHSSLPVEAPQNETGGLQGCEDADLGAATLGARTGSTAVNIFLPTVPSQPEDHAGKGLSSGAGLGASSRPSESIDAFLSGDSAVNGHPSGLWIRTQRQSGPVAVAVHMTQR